VHTPCVGITEQEDGEQGIDEQDIFDRMVLFLATITLCPCRRVLGTNDATLGAVMGKRGDGGAVARASVSGTGFSSSGVTTVAASVSETPKRCARAVRERAGASPRARNAASSTGRRT
jgi:hypothetical protein